MAEARICDWCGRTFPVNDTIHNIKIAFLKTGVGSDYDKRCGTSCVEPDICDRCHFRLEATINDLIDNIRLYPNLRKENSDE